MSYRTGYARKRCKLDGCGSWASRSCRVCERPVCRGHRFGSGHWFRCYLCSPEALREARALWEEQEREERTQERAAAQDGPFPASQGPFPCGEPPGVPVQVGGVVLFYRLAVLRELVDDLGVERARLRGEPVPLAAHSLEALRSPGRGGRRRGRPMPWRQWRRWRRKGAPRRGGRVVLPPRYPRPRRKGRAPDVRALRLVRLAVVLSVALALVVEPLSQLAGHLGRSTSPAVPQLPAARVAVVVDVHAGATPAPGGQPQPAKGQKRAPCIARLEVELGGYCWLPLEYTPAQCPPQAVVHEGRCLLPMAPQPRPPMSMDAGVR
ncbi:hypothetical protein F0U59_26705 [Archangium gephyra]|nr:hypothetical protein F0U59_26705 [Archangium gephyra]